MLRERMPSLPNGQHHAGADPVLVVDIRLGRKLCPIGLQDCGSLLHHSSVLWQMSIHYIRFPRVFDNASKRCYDSRGCENQKT